MITSWCWPLRYPGVAQQLYCGSSTRTKYKTVAGTVAVHGRNEQVFVSSQRTSCCQYKRAAACVGINNSMTETCGDSRTASSANSHYFYLSPSNERCTTVDTRRTQAIRTCRETLWTPDHSRQKSVKPTHCTLLSVDVDTRYIANVSRCPRAMQNQRHNKL